MAHIHVELVTSSIYYHQWYCYYSNYTNQCIF